MNKLLSKIISKAVSSVSQTSTDEIISIAPSAEISAACREIAAEGIILLKNDDMLPLKKNEKISLFGRVQINSFFVGYGSGGDVKSHYNVNFYDALASNDEIILNKSLYDIYNKWCSKNIPDDGFWGHWPMCYDEMPLSETIIKSTKEDYDNAIVFIGRAAGEDRENTLTEGSYYLTEIERDMLSKVCAAYKKVAVVLNIGSIMDMSWTQDYNISALLIAWQGGMEAGNALADIITGKTAPSGCLPDTIAREYDDYPSSSEFGNRNENIYKEDIYVGYRYFDTFAKDKVLYPFGFGLTYTDFKITDISFDKTSDNNKVSFSISNIGTVPSKKCVQLYCRLPQGKLGNPELVLCGYLKTAVISPDQSENYTLEFNNYDISSFDDNGMSGYINSYVLEAGKYEIFIGFSSREILSAGYFIIEKTTPIKQLNEYCAPDADNLFMRLKPLCINSNYIPTKEPVSTRTVSLHDRILSSLPKTIQISVGNNYTLRDVKNNKCTMDEFIGTLTYDELEAISRGDYIMNSPLGAKGNAGVFGGVTESLRNKGIRPVTCTDGPSGIRLSATSSLLPCGTLMASSWNEELITKLYQCVADEMLERGSDVLLAPGMNIHRNPLCGRNFEYFSEDPLISGKCAAAVVKGLQSKGVSACPKHFACNNQEANRTENNSAVSQRALRQIYLKGFEICVRESDPWNIMTSYNKINGVWSHYNYELVTGILRGEWNYKGNVITDWWMKSSVSPEFPYVRDQAYRVRAGVDVLMPGGSRTGKKVPDGTLLENIEKKEAITTAELQLSAKHVCDLILKLKEKVDSDENCN